MAEDTRFRLVFNTAGGQILLDHQCHLKGNGIVKLPQIQTGQLLDLFQAVHQSVPVDKKLTGGFGNVQIGCQN